MSGVGRVLLAVCAAAGTASAMTLPRGGTVESPTRGSKPPTAQELTVPYDGLYQFVRIRYDVAGRGGFGRGGREPMWAHDYPRADRNFLKIVDEATHVRTRLDGTNVLTADDPRLFRYPIAYIVEVGSWNPDADEVAALSAYLRKGGFVIVDDFRGRFALDNLAYQIDRLLPGGRMLPLDPSHGIFDSFFRIIPDEVIPPYGNEPPIWFGVFEDDDPDGRILMVVNYNNDLAEYWEYSDYGYYPIDLSNEAYKLGVNYVVYAYAH